MGQCAVHHRREYGDRRIKPDPVQRVLSGCGDGIILPPKPVLRSGDHAVYQCGRPERHPDGDGRETGAVSYTHLDVYKRQV